MRLCRPLSDPIAFWQEGCLASTLSTGNRTPNTDDHVPEGTHLARLAGSDAEPPALRTHNAGHRVGAGVSGDPAGLWTGPWWQRAARLHEYGQQRHRHVAR